MPAIRKRSRPWPSGAHVGRSLDVGEQRLSDASGTGLRRTRGPGAGVGLVGLSDAASLTLFTHPDTVAQIPGHGALFPAVRDFRRRRSLGELNGRAVGFDDNETAHDAFGWCNPGLPRWRDVQLNHVWLRSSDPDCFTAPANLCASPSFLAKLSDHDAEIAALIRQRAFELYDWTPPGESAPHRPMGYERLVWAPPLPAVTDLEASLRARLRAAPNATAARVAREIGWAFSNWTPDPQP